MADVTIQQAIIAVLVTMAAGLVIMFVPNRRYLFRKEDAEEPKKIPFIIGLVLTLVSIAFGIYGGVLLNKAFEHGLYDMNLPVAPLPEQVRLSPKDQSEEFGKYVEDNGTPQNVIVSMYRLTCPHCEAIFEDLDARLRSMPYETFWVSSRSPVGMQLRDLYDVTDVPAIISFDAKGRASVSIIYTTDAAGNAKLDNAALDLIEHTLQMSQPETGTQSEDAADKKDTKENETEKIQNLNATTGETNETDETPSDSDE